MRLTTITSLRAYALGFMGALYEQDGRLEDALRLTNRAVFLAQEVVEPEQRYRWEWQAGRILRAQGRLEDARRAYEQAVATLDPVRANLASGSGETFDALVAPVYTQYADLLTQQAKTVPAPEDRETLLRRVRDQLESLKQGELEDYFAGSSEKSVGELRLGQPTKCMI